MQIEPKDSAVGRPPMFSVVIPTYNRLEFLKQALASVWAQTYTDYEVIVVDDGSTDGTREWLTRQTERVHTVTQPNCGPGAARNAGVGQAEGRYVAFLDSDDVWLPWTLAIFDRAIREYNFPCVLGGKFVEFADVAELAGIEKTTYQALQFADYLASSHYSCSVGSGTCVLDREVLSATGFLEDQLNSEDHDLILRMGCARGFMQILSPMTVGWRRHSVSETADVFRGTAGALRLLERERSCCYPGGPARARERHRILARHTRPIALRCVREGDLERMWEIYWSIFFWNLADRRWKFLLGLPVLAAKKFIERLLRREPRATYPKSVGSR